MYSNEKFNLLTRNSISSFCSMTFYLQKMSILPALRAKNSNVPEKCGFYPYENPMLPSENVESTQRKVDSTPKRLNIGQK